MRQYETGFVLSPALSEEETFVVPDDAILVLVRDREPGPREE